MAADRARGPVGDRSLLIRAARPAVFTRLPAVTAVMLLLVLAALPARGDDRYVWWEGEAARDTNFPAKTWFSPRNDQERDRLSGGRWLSNINERTGEEAFAFYDVRVPSDGTYQFWARKFWKHGPFKWRFGTAEWRTCGRDIALADSTYLRKHVCANWVHLGEVALTRGTHAFELRLLAAKGEKLTAAFDCFLLAMDPFEPNGKRKPGEKSGLAEEGWFAFEPGPDPFRADALLDLRHLNEDAAGQSGFVRRDGPAFVLGNGEPVRFWAVNVGPNNVGQHRGSIDYLARRLAKLGVNMVRYHGPVFDPTGDPAKADAKRLDDVFYLVNALKKQGIYTTLSFYFPLWFDVKPHYGLPGYNQIKNKKPFALIFFEPRMQEIYRSWARQLLTTTSPYSGLPLARDPAVAIVEVVNEDSYFFWTFSRRNIPQRYWKKLEGLYSEWLAARHGSVAKALAAWPRTRHKDDRPQANHAALFEAWHMTAGGLKRARADKRKRIGEQVRFLAEHQRAFYEDTIAHFRNDLACRSLISCSNWKVSDPSLLDALERHTYTAGDVIDRHGYFGGQHKGDGAAYSVRVGHTFRHRAAVSNPERLPIQVFQVAGHPHIVSEIGWPNPNRYRADASFLAGAYGALQGIDGFYFFSIGSNNLLDAGMSKFAASCPVIAGTFPAASLMYRRGDVREAEPVVRQQIALDDLFAMKGSGWFAAQALDALRKRDVPRGAPAAGAPRDFDPLSFYAGPVVRQFEKASSTSRHADLRGRIDRAAKTVRSITDELSLDYGNGVVTVNTPRCQGAAGFLAAAGPIALGRVTIACENEFASVLVISLDDRPLATSRKILVQAMTEEKPYGFRVEGNRIADVGASPFNVRKIACTISLKLDGRGAVKAIALDANGYAADKPLSATGPAGRGRFVLPLAGDVLYTLLRR